MALYKVGASVSLSFLLASVASAQSVIENLSFGHRLPLAPAGGSSVPNWQLSSVNHQPQLLSDRLILTPPVPGNTKGALWTRDIVPVSDWSVELEFRASGQDTGSGNLQLWYTKDKTSVGTDSVYGAGNFDGLVLLFDQYGSRGGSIRGFLNDGTQDFRNHPNLESLAFGHCDYAYRNLGRPSKLRVKSLGGLSVFIDDRECFSSNKISLPSGYFFGLTANTAENPDAFEIYRFQTSSESSSNQGSSGNVQARNEPASSLPPIDIFPGAPEALADADSDTMTSSVEQFRDLHNRLQSLGHISANIFVELKTLSQKIEQAHDDLAATIQRFEQTQRDAVTDLREIQGSKEPGVTNAIYRLNQRTENIELVLDQLRKDLAGKDFSGKDYSDTLRGLQTALDRVQGGLSDHLPEKIGSLMQASAPRLGMFVFIIVAVQILLAGGYVLYKRRRAAMPKKYI